MIVEGNVAFSNLTKFDEYMGQSTGKYSLVVTIPDEAAGQLESQGVRVKTYQPEEGDPLRQRKFSSKYDINVMDAEGSPFSGEVPRGSLVRLKYKLGQEHPVHGMGTYLVAVKVLEVAQPEEAEDNEDF